MNHILTNKFSCLETISLFLVLGKTSWCLATLKLLSVLISGKTKTNKKQLVHVHEVEMNHAEQSYSFDVLTTHSESAVGPKMSTRTRFSQLF